MICDRCSKKVEPFTVKDDDEEDGATCDTCGSMAIEVPGLGYFCMNSRLPLTEIKGFYLYHPETVSMWRRLVWRIRA